MTIRNRRAGAWLASLSLLLHPVAANATAEPSPAPPPLRTAVVAPLGGFIPAAMPTPLLSPVGMVPVSAMPAHMLAAQREVIVEALIELGEEDDRARDLAGNLTAEDLEVLAANPRMMQRAGDLFIIIAAVVIVGVIVVLLIAADSSSASIN